MVGTYLLPHESSKANMGPFRDFSIATAPTGEAPSASPCCGAPPSPRAALVGVSQPLPSPVGVPAFDEPQVAASVTALGAIPKGVPLTSRILLSVARHSPPALAHGVPTLGPVVAKVSEAGSCGCARPTTKESRADYSVVEEGLRPTFRPSQGALATPARYRDAWLGRRSALEPTVVPRPSASLSVPDGAHPAPSPRLGLRPPWWGP